MVSSLLPLSLLLLPLSLLLALAFQSLAAHADTASLSQLEPT
jgi:hypothetical protein